LYVLILYSESCLLYSVLRNFSISQNSKTYEPRRYKVNELVLVDEGSAKAEIYLPPDAQLPVRYAAEELQEHLRRMSGAELAIVNKLDKKSAILVGRCAEADALVGNVDWEGLGDDGILLRTVGNRLILTGNTPRGALYAVYELLDAVLGCRWLTPDCLHVPPRQTVAIRPLNIYYRPTLWFRHPRFKGWGRYNEADADWAARNRANGQAYPLTDKHGGQWAHAGGSCHTFHSLVPPSQYFVDHPEYFAEVDGKRVRKNAQLCLTNPDVLEIAVKKARQWLRQEPKAKFISVSQIDSHECYCRCDACRRVDKEEGSHAGTLIRFVNAVAERLEQEFPYVFVTTLAYVYTVDPPKITRPRHNVVIRLCDMSHSMHEGGMAYACEAHPLETCPQNKPFMDIVRRWVDVSPHVHVWDYSTNFANYFMPFPNLDAIMADIRWLATNGVVGIYCQGCGAGTDGSPDKGPGDMAELRAYLCAKLLWNPSADGWAIVDEFLDLYYGPAGRMIREYLDMLHKPLRKGRLHFFMYEMLPHPLLTRERLAKAEFLFDQAEHAVQADNYLLKRVKIARLPVDYIRWQYDLHYVIRDGQCVPADDAIVRKAIGFLDLAVAHGATGLREWLPNLEQTRKNIFRSVPAVTIGDNRLRAGIVPAFGGRLLEFIDANGMDWLHHARPTDAAFPCAGGYGEGDGGWYECVKDENTAIVRSAFDNGILCERKYQMIDRDGQPAIAIKTRRINTSNQERQAAINMQTELSAGDWSQLRLKVKQADGSWLEMDPWNKPAEDNAYQGQSMHRGKKKFAEDGLPCGACMLIRDGRKMSIEFDGAPSGSCSVEWNLMSGMVSLKLSTRAQRLQPGDEVVARQILHFF